MFIIPLFFICKAGRNNIVESAERNNDYLQKKREGWVKIDTVYQGGERFLRVMDIDNNIVKFERIEK